MSRTRLPFNSTSSCRTLNPPERMRACMPGRVASMVPDCPVTEKVSDQLVRLPFHNALTEEDLERVVEAVREYDF